MEKKNILTEMSKVTTMVKAKMNRDNGFSPFIVSYSVINGNKMVQFGGWDDSDEEKKAEIWKVVAFVKSEQPYGFVMGAPATRDSHKSKENYLNDVPPEETTPVILVIAKTPDKSYHQEIQYSWNGKTYDFNDGIMEDDTEANDENVFNSIFKGLN